MKYYIVISNDSANVNGHDCPMEWLGTPTIFKSKESALKWMIEQLEHPNFRGPLDDLVHIPKSYLPDMTMFDDVDFSWGWSYKYENEVYWDVTETVGFTVYEMEMEE